MGFFSTIKDCVRQVKDVKPGQKDMLKSQIWKTFHMLLEYTYRSEYKLLSKKLTEQYVDIIKGLKENINEINEDYMKKDTAMRRKMGYINEQFGVVE